MKKLQFTIEIHAPAIKVWDALWIDENYRQWASAFQPGSYFVSELSEGSEIQFLNPEENGMYGVVEKNVRNEKMHILHKGEIQNGQKQPESYGADAIEQYDLEERDEVTALTATMNVPEDYIPYFAEVFPKALEKVKEIAEKL